MELKDHIITEATELLQRIGPTSMTMDMVARSCGISKRTLYETFPDKRTLVKDCLEMEHRRHNDHVKCIFEQSENCLMALFNVYAHVREAMRSRSRAFVADLKRLYPELFARQREQERHFVDTLAQVLTRAQAEGHVLPDINTRIAAFLFVSTMRNLHENDRVEEYGLPRIEVFDDAFLNFLRGIATNEGQQVLNVHVDELRKQRNT